MKIHFVTEGSLNEYWERGPKVNCDVLVFGFSGLGEVEYGRELAGETSKLEDLAILSREAGCVVLSGCMTASYGMRRRSAAPFPATRYFHTHLPPLSRGRRGLPTGAPPRGCGAFLCVLQQ